MEAIEFIIVGILIIRNNRHRAAPQPILQRVLGSKRIKISAKLLRPNEKQVHQAFKN